MSMMPPTPARPGLFDNLAAIFRQSRHPIYNSARKQVGSYDTLDALCRGTWYRFTNIAQPPVSELYVMDFWGRFVPLSLQCSRAARANVGGPSIVYPQPVQPASAAKASQDSGNTAALIDALTQREADYAALPDAGAPGMPGGLSQAQLVTYATYGVLALAGIALLMPSGRRR